MTGTIVRTLEEKAVEKQVPAFKKSVFVTVVSCFKVLNQSRDICEHFHSQGGKNNITKQTKCDAYSL